LKKLKFIEAQFSKQEEFGPKVYELVGSAVNKDLVEPVDHKASCQRSIIGQKTAHHYKSQTK
jgi:hypothetical protein